MKKTRDGLNYLYVSLGIGAVSLMTGCTIETAAEHSATNESVDATELLITEVKLSNGGRLGWYETAPGSLLIGRSFSVGKEQNDDFSPTEVQGLSPTELFDLIVARVPQTVSDGARKALVDAEARQAELTETMKNIPREPAESGEGPPVENLPPSTTNDVGVVRSAAIDDAWPWEQFQNLQSCWRGNAWKVNWSRITGDTWFRRTDNNRAAVAAGSYRGTISYKVRKNTWSWETPVNVTLAAGQGWEWSNVAGAFDFDVESSVSNATGDGYHHCGAGTR